ncbi:hypothetical protein L5G32_18875 [Gordonia sp. HY002]|uniref:hypothetical protein n=1 Tax=Gordonia zhenghanii TaxID=2911516 RepID=UPI001EF0ADC9|nr:hypothetical protein [Gordonia zhenghanii]MCF8572323.1 hypothetical protein [Gordonia zhenghanii]MCF8606754.1 hypothetical protein [Gordonia zhenghanii]
MMALYRVDLVEVVHRTATIEVPDGYEFDDPVSQGTLMDVARDVALETDSREERIEIRPVHVASSVDYRLK